MLNTWFIRDYQTQTIPGDTPKLKRLPFSWSPYSQHHPDLFLSPSVFSTSQVVFQKTLRKWDLSPPSCVMSLCFQPSDETRSQHMHVHSCYLESLTFCSRLTKKWNALLTMADKWTSSAPVCVVTSWFLPLYSLNVLSVWILRCCRGVSVCSG